MSEIQYGEVVAGFQRRLNRVADPMMGGVCGVRRSS